MLYYKSGNLIVRRSQTRTTMDEVTKMTQGTPLSVRLLDAEDALDYGAALARESRSQFIRVAVKHRARILLEARRNATHRQVSQSDRRRSRQSSQEVAL
jgi:uncharacterized protein (DUF1778 family)